jgi:hypothetical protein
MAKNMARIEDGVVVNIEWCSDEQEQTESLIDLSDRPVGIGDTFDGVDFYRNGEKLLSDFDRLRNKLADADAALRELGAEWEE